MRITTRNLFKAFIVIFVATVLAIIVFNLAKSYLPVNKVTHECKPPENTAKNVIDELPVYTKGFCQDYYHAEFKDSWDRTFNNIVVPIGLLSGLLLIPTGVVLLSRRIPAKGRNIDSTGS